MNVISMPLPTAPTVEEPPKRQKIRKRSRVLARVFQIAFGGSIVFALLLAGAVAFYDGPFLSFGPGGIWFGQAPESAPGLVALTGFSLTQRLAGAAAVLTLASPAALILHSLWRLFRLYATGILFDPVNALHIKSVAVGLMAYAFAPFAANRLIVLFGITNDPVWFHVDQIVSFLLGCLLFVIAEIITFGGEIELDRDGFV